MRASLILACGFGFPLLMCGCAPDPDEAAPLDSLLWQSTATGDEQDEVLTEVTKTCRWAEVADALGIVGDTAPLRADILPGGVAEHVLALTYAQAPPTTQPGGIWIVIQGRFPWTRVTRNLCIAGRTEPMAADVVSDERGWLVLLKYCLAPPVQTGEVALEDWR